MAAAAATPFILGTNHRSSPVALRDLLHLPEAALPAALGELAALGLDEAVILCTCDRFEVLGVGGDPAVLRPWIDARAGGAATEPHLYLHRDAAAVRHLFGVAASLDSLVIGEPQILGQVHAARRAAQRAGTLGPVLDDCLQAAFAAAKRVRTETRIAAGPVSMAAVAIARARDTHGDLSRAAGLLIGLGDMGEPMAEALREAGLGRLAVTAPSLARAEEAARRLGCHVAGFAPLVPALAQADIVVTALGSGRATLGAADFESALRLRRRRPMLVVDLGVPPDVDRAVDRIEDVFRFDLDDLERLATEGRRGRAAAAEAARAIVAAESEAYLRGRQARAAVPALTALRSHFEAERRRALEEAGGDAVRATELLVNRLLHAPTAALRAIAAGPGPVDAVAAERLLRQIFALPAAGAPETPPEDQERGR